MYIYIYIYIHIYIYIYVYMYIYSLLSSCVMEFIRHNRQVSVELPARSMLIMSGNHFK